MAASDGPAPLPRFSVRGALRRTFSSLDTYNYRLFFGGELISYIGSWMQTMAEAWLVLELTGNGVAVGATFACRFLPVALFGLWGGAVADHFDRRRVLLVTQSLAALLAIVLWLIVLTDVVNVWMVFALAIALGFVTVVDEPARHAFVEEMVGPEKLPNAVALNSAVMNSARITGPAIAGSPDCRARRVVGVLRQLRVVRCGRRRTVRDAKDGAAVAASPDDSPTRARGPQVRMVTPRDPGDDRDGRRRRHARLQLPDVPDAHGPRHVRRRRRPRRASSWPCSASAR